MERKSNYIYILSVLILCACNEHKKQEVSSSEQSIAIETEGVLVSNDSISMPSVNLAKAPEVLSVSEGTAIPYENSVHPLRQPTITALGENYFKEHKVAITLPPLIKAAEGKTVACNLSEPKPAAEMRFKDNASFNIQYLDVAQGLPLSYVSELFEDKSGNIWINCKGVIVKYNGRSFVNFTEKNELLRGHPQMKEDNQGNIWMATRNGLLKYNGKFFIQYDTLGGLPHNEVTAIELDKDGNIWVGTPKGLTKFDGTKFYTYSKEHGMKGGWITAIRFDRSGQLWCGTTDAGLYCFNGNSLVNISKKEGLLDNVVHAMGIDKSGNIWTSCEYGANKFDGKTVMAYNVESGMINSNARNLIVDRDNNVWFSAYRGGMSCFDGKNFTWYTEKEGLSISTVDCLMEDHNGNIWAGTDGGGLSKFTPKSFNHFIPSKGFQQIIMSICEDDKKNIWLGSYDEGLYKYDGSNIIRMNDKDGAIGTVMFMLKDKSGAIWMNAKFGGVLKYDGKNFVRYRKEQGLFSNEVGVITEDKEGNIWMGTNNGAIKFDGKQFTRYNKEQGLLSDDVRDIAQDLKGNIWIATGSGINKLEEGVMKSYTDSNGLPRKNIKNLIIDKAGNLWVGTVGGGLYHYDGKHMIKLTKEHGLSDNIIRSIIEDKEWNVRSGYSGVWTSTDNGINHITMKDNSNLMKDLQIITYGRQDGLRGEDFCSNSGIMDSRGRAWWGSVKGLTSLQTNNLKIDVVTPKIKLDYINLEQNYVDFNALEDSVKKGKDWFVGEKEKRNLATLKFSGVQPFGNYPLDLELPYNINNVTFNYSAISWLGGHKIKYQYILQGSDKEWHPITAETKAIYTGLTDGTYTFKVKAKGVTDKWSQPLAYTFVVKPPWWKTVWAYLLYAFVFVGGTLYYLNFRTRALRKRQKELEQIVIERTADVVEEKNRVEEKNKIIELKQKEILDSIHYAENIQHTLLANHDFVNETIPDSFVFFRPKDIVSGDFYWATKVNELFYLAVCDSTGHGVPGAFMSLLNISFLNEAINEKNIREPKKVFDHVRQRLIENISQDGRKDGMDGILICLDTSTGSICYAASNNSPVLISQNQFLQLSTDKMPVGIGDRTEPFKQFDIKYKKGDMLYVFTDGYSDQFGGPKGKKFKIKQLNELLLSIAGLTLAEQKDKICNEFENWRGNLEQVDDVCVLGIRL